MLYSAWMMDYPSPSSFTLGLYKHLNCLPLSGGRKKPLFIPPSSRLHVFFDRSKGGGGGGEGKSRPICGVWNPSIYGNALWQMFCPTTGGGMQSGSSVRMHAHFVHVFARFAPDLHARSVLINKVSASELSRKFIKSALLAGCACLIHVDHSGHKVSRIHVGSMFLKKFFFVRPTRWSGKGGKRKGGDQRGGAQD